VNQTSNPAEAPSVDEFLGTKPRPAWRRTMKYWLPALIALIVIALILAVIFREKPKPDYITAAVAKESLSLSVTATGNLRPTNQV
jgi:HlyD family secretion protein